MSRVRTPLVLATLAALYVAVPTVVQIARASHDPHPVVTEQVATARVAVPADVASLVSSVRAAWDAKPGAPLILTYHDLSEHPTSEFTVTPTQFAAHMAALAALDARTLSADEFTGWIRGRSLPERAVLLTFDDGTSGVWRYADSILAEYGFKATAFVITGFVGSRRPYYLTWQELDRLHKTGRWSIEAHSHDGHRRIQTSATGTTGSFFGSLAWRDGRHETMAEYRQRVNADLTRNAEELRKRGYGTGGLFSFPFSDYGATTVPGEASEALLAMTRNHFRAVFNDSRTPLPLGGPYHFNRLGVGRADSTSDLLTRLTALIDRQPSVL